jgi:hypothetical protein
MPPMLFRNARVESAMVGRASYFVAPLVLLAAAGFGFLARDDGRLLTAALETAVPLVVGIYAASILATEPALELQLATPGGFRPAALRRLAVLIGWGAIVCAAGWWIADASGTLSGWQPNVGLVESQLVWLPSLLAYSIGGFLLAIVFRNRSSAVSVLALFWIGGHSFHDVFETTSWLRVWYPALTTYEPTASDWEATRLILLLLAAVAFAGLAAWLGASEWLLSAEDR